MAFRKFRINYENRLDVSLVNCSPVHSIPLGENSSLTTYDDNNTAVIATHAYGTPQLLIIIGNNESVDELVEKMNLEKFAEEAK